MNLVKININGKDYEVEQGINVLEACRSVGVEVPYFCYHPKLKVAGSCRMCLVSIGMPARDRATGELLKNADGTPQIAFAPKPAISCGTNVAENMHVITNSDEIKNCRASVLEFILLNHPLDCPICDKAGECKLQEYAAAYGSGVSRFTEDKNVKPKKQEIGGKIILDNERCILCSRCIRIARKLTNKDVFGFTKRGSLTELTVYDQESTNSNYLLNVVDNCPVGALTQKDFRFKMRTWFLKAVDGICAESSAGINTRIWSREGVIYRITPRQNDEVNSNWMTDSGRDLYKRFSQTNRLLNARIDSLDCQSSYAISRTTDILSLGEVAIVASGWQTLEEMFLLKDLVNLTSSKIHMASHLGEDDQYLLSADKTPNLRGAFITGLIDKYPKENLEELKADVLSGKVKTILCLREDLLKLGFEAKDLKGINIIYCGSLENQTSKIAKICIPMQSEYEKEGIWVNRQFRMQKFNRAIKAQESVVEDYKLIFEFIKLFTKSSMKMPSIAQLREQMAEKIEELKDIKTLSSSGIVLDSSRFEDIEFPESNAYKYQNNKA